MQTLDCVIGMSVPKRNRQWLREIKNSYKRASKIVARGEISILDIHQLAPTFAAKERGVEDITLIDTMIDAAVTAVEQDAEVDEESRERCKFNFVSSYVFAHVHMGYLAEHEADRLMDYLNSSWDLFDDIDGTI